MSRATIRSNPFGLYIGIDAVSAFASTLAYATSVVYYVRSGHLNPLELILLGTMVEAAYFIFQIPTGALADLVSRRLCVIVGVVLIGVGFLLQGLSPAFAVLLLAQIPVGIGSALVLGAQEAWLADETGTDELTKVFLRATQFGLVGALVGSVLSGVVAGVGLRVPFLAAGIVMILLGGTLIVLMPEHNFRPPARVPQFDSVVRDTWHTLIGHLKTARAAMVAVPALVLMLMTTLFMGLWGESFDRLWGDYMLKDIRFPHSPDLSTAMWFSLLAAAVALLSLGSTELARRRVERLGPTSIVGTLLFVTLFTAAAVLGMTLARSFGPAALAYLVIATVRPVFAPLTSGWMLARVNPSIRATALSTVDLFDSGGQILGGPIIGVIGVLGSIRSALLAGSAALIPAAAFLVAASKRLRAHQEWATAAEEPTSDSVSRRLDVDEKGPERMH